VRKRTSLGAEFPQPVRKRTSLEVEVGAGALCREGLLELLGGGAHDAVVEGERTLVLHVLGDAEGLVATAHELSGDGGSAHDLQVGETRPVAGGNLLVHLGNSAVHRHVTVLPVSIVVAGTGVIAGPDAV
jgi:hypothetical protein